MSSNPTYIGVDPGISGAIAFYTPANEDLLVFDMPIAVRSSGKKEISVEGLSSMVDGQKAFKRLENAFYEDVGAMVYVDRYGVKRGQGAASSFSFGKSIGVVLGVLVAHGVKVKGLQAAVWKGIVGLSKDKNLSREKAVELFPGYERLFELKKHDGRAEAAILAWLCSERFK